MRRPRTVAVAGLVVLALALLAAGYVYFFSGLRSAPAALTLTRPSGPAPTASASPTAGAATWTVTNGSIARYRVNEVFAGTTSNHEAVAETSDLSGDLTLASAPGSGTNSLADLKIVASLTGLHSVDTVAGLNVSQRDRIVQQTLSTSRFPDATFTAQGVALPQGATTGSAQPFTVTGLLNIHGIAKTADVTVKQLQVNGATAQVVGQTAFNMTDFGIQPPALPITAVQPQVTLEFQLNLARS